MPIGNVIKSVQNIMRQDTGVDGDAQRISQLGWMIFLKILDDKEKELELRDPKYKSPIPKRLCWRNWASDEEGITGDELLEFINNDLFKTLKELTVDARSDRRTVMVRNIFLDAYNYMKSGTLIRQVINKISTGIDFNKSEDHHIFNDIYEKILKDLQSAGNAGEYYTPRAVTQFMADMVNPKLGEKILDPACGTGGFLVCALENIRKSDVKNIDARKKLQECIMGIEKKPLPHLLAMTNLILHDIELPQISRDNSLARPIRDIGEKDRVDVILTNPPFGGIEEVGIASNFPANFQTKETADLFVLLIVNLLKHEGRCGMVLPDGSLTGEGVKQRIRQHLLENCNLHTIVRLPNSVFQPYAGVATNLLFFEKGTPTKEIWYYEHKLPDDVKSYNKTNPIRINEFDPIKKWWKKRKESELVWKVQVKDIIDGGYNLDIKNPHEPESPKTQTSAELVTMLHDSFHKSEELLDKLKKELGND